MGRRRIPLNEKIVTVSVALRPSEIQHIDHIADRLEMSRSEILRSIIRDGLEEWDLE